MRPRLFEIIQIAEEDDLHSRVYDVFLVIAALLSIVPSLFRPGDVSEFTATMLRYIDIITVFILLFDYLMRWITHDIKRAQRGKKGLWRAMVIYPFTPMAIIDFLAIIPTLAPGVETLSILRLLRLFKLLRVSQSMKLVRNVFIREGRTLISVFCIVLLFIFLSATIMYVNEYDTFDNFLDALYWAANALTTVGYGDVYPQTDVGRAINIVSALFGIAVIALPTGVITAGYVAELRHQRRLGSRRQQEIDIDRPFAERVREGYATTKRVLREEAFSTYFKRYPRVARFAAVMFGCNLLSIVLTVVLADYDSINIGFDAAGTAIAAFVLEPAAGIIVAFINCLAYCIMTADIANLTMFFGTAVIAIGFGHFVSLRGPITREGVMRAIVFLLVAYAVLAIPWACFVAIEDPGFEALAAVTAHPFPELYRMFLDAGMLQGPAVFAALYIDSLLLALVLAAVVAFTVFFSRVVRRNAWWHRREAEAEADLQFCGTPRRIAAPSSYRMRPAYQVRKARRAYRRPADVGISDGCSPASAGSDLAACGFETDAAGHGTGGELQS